ncbi:CPBP family glutamic-type intramembrane protease [Rhodocaloribacter sp.]
MEQTSPPGVQPPPPTPPVLLDAWEPRRPIPLDGVLERNKYPPLLTALLGLVLVFILFQVVIAPIVVVALLLMNGTPPGELITALMNMVDDQPGVLMVANTVGQVFGIALPAYFFARMHSSRPWAFLRLRKPAWTLLVLALLGLVALVPVVQWLGQVSDALPWPDAIRQFEQAQLELIEKVLDRQIGLLPTLLMLAVTPALCEELLFRGYFQRQAERGLGVFWGLTLTGVVFGLYHLRLTQALPLIVLGIYLAYVAWRSGSLWTSVVVHFANNAFAVFLGAYAAQRPDLEAADLEKMEVPWFILLPALVFFLLFVYAIRQTARAALARRATADRPPDSRP